MSSGKINAFGAVFIGQDVLRQVVCFAWFAVRFRERSGRWLTWEESSVAFITLLKDILLLQQWLTFFFLCHVILGWAIIKRWGWALHAMLIYTSCATPIWLFIWRRTGFWWYMTHVLVYLAATVILTRPAVRAQFRGRQS